MKVYPASAIHNVAVVGHNGVGKTTLVSALLHEAGATPRFGRVEEGNAPTDFDPEEVERKISIGLAVASLEWKKKKINLIDTPGYGIFVSEMICGLRAADAALIVVDAVAGVEVQTEKAWKVCDELGLPRLVVVNRMDRERADGGRVMEQLQKKFGRACVCVEAPIGREKGFRGVIDLVAMQGWLTDDAGKTAPGADSGRVRHRRRLPAREPRRDGRRGRRQAHGDVLLAGQPDRGADEAGPQEGDPGAQDRARPLHGEREPRDRRREAPRRDRRPPPDRRRFPDRREGQGRERRGTRRGSGGPGGRLRLQDDLRPLLGPAHALPRRLGDGQERRDVLERARARSPSVSARSSHPSGRPSRPFPKSPRATSAASRSSRRRSPATRCRRRTSRSSSSGSPSPSRRSRSRSSRRPRATRRRSRRRSRSSSRRIPLSSSRATPTRTSSSSPAPASSTSRSRSRV